MPSLPSVSLQSMMVIAFATTEAIASVILLADDPVVVPVPPPVDLLTDNRMIAFCLIGSVLGGLVSIVVFPPHASNGNVLRALGLNFLASSFCGVMFAPALVEYHAARNGGRVSTALILAGAGVLSIFAIMVLTYAAKYFPALFPKFVEWLTGGRVKFDTPKDEPPATP